MISGRKHVWPGLALATSLLLICCGPALGDTLLDRQAPAFELADSDGETFRYPEDLSGPTVVLFWASWCRKTTTRSTPRNGKGS
jgi:hypothetical protein